VSPVVRWESDAELLADAARREWGEHDRRAIARLRAAAAAGLRLWLDEVGAVALWSHDGARWECLCACSSHSDAADYCRAAEVFVAGLGLAPPVATAPPPE
jgi:hypothetical protein